MSVIDTLITDRTQADVDEIKQMMRKGKANATAAEMQKLRKSQKGSYNASDLNRVIEAVQYIAERLRTECGYEVELQEIKSDWDYVDIPTPKTLNIYLLNCETVRAILKLPDGTPTVPPDMENFTWSEANDIEKILVVVNTLIDNIAGAWFYSGDLYAGEV